MIPKVGKNSGGNDDDVFFMGPDENHFQNFLETREALLVSFFEQLDEFGCDFIGRSAQMHLDEGADHLVFDFFLVGEDQQDDQRQSFLAAFGIPLVELGEQLYDFQDVGLSLLPQQGFHFAEDLLYLNDGFFFLLQHFLLGSDFLHRVSYQVPFLTKFFNSQLVALIRHLFFYPFFVFCSFLHVELQDRQLARNHFLLSELDTHWPYAINDSTDQLDGLPSDFDAAIVQSINGGLQEDYHVFLRDKLLHGELTKNSKHIGSAKGALIMGSLNEEDDAIVGRFFELIFPFLLHQLEGAEENVRRCIP